MGQIQRPSSPVPQLQVPEKLREAFEALKNTPVSEEKTRKVLVLFKSCCGCGPCEDVIIEREVPLDSPLQNKDRINRLQKGDKMIPIK